MKIIDLLQEQARAPLFHGMKLEYAAQALRDNKMLATTTQRWWPDGKRRKDDDPEYQGSYWMKGLSFTRDREYAISWGGVVFVIDQDKLRQKYKFIPFNWGYSLPRGNNHKREREEFLVVQATPDTYMKTHDSDGDKLDRPVIDMKRFEAPGGEVKNLNSFLKGVYIEKATIEIFGEDDENVKFIMSHPKFIGIVDRKRKK
jgi:hypothetical protein